MVPEKILYTDGHEVTVTDSFFKVKKSSYQLNGITKHGFFTIHPDRLTPFLIVLLGGMIVTLGAMRMIPDNLLPRLHVMSFHLKANAVAVLLGTVVAATGALLLGLMRDRYAIRIATAEGEKNVVVSRRREYVYQILDALNYAFHVVAPSRQQRRMTEKGK